MKRVIVAIMSGVLLSCQGPAAVLAQEGTATARGGARGDQCRPLSHPEAHDADHDLSGAGAALSAHDHPCRSQGANGGVSKARPWIAFFLHAAFKELASRPDDA